MHSSWIADVLYLSLALLAYPAIPRARAQSTNATCHERFPWLINVRNQSPCLVAAYLMGACEPDGQWQVSAIEDKNLTYVGPSLSNANICTCSSVTYSLVAACAYCQEARLPSFDGFTASCPAAVVKNGTYDHSTPPGTAIPSWAYLLISSAGSGVWNPVIAEAYWVTHPESASITSSSIPVPSPTPPPPPSPPPPVTPSKHSNLGAIIGGTVAGALGIIGTCVIAIFLWRRFHRNQTTAPSAAYGGTSHNDYRSTVYSAVSDDKSQLASPGSPAFTPGGQAGQFPILPHAQARDSYIPPTAAPMRIYNPDDPTTYPLAYQHAPGQPGQRQSENFVVYTPRLSPGPPTGTA
ncbi:hypothetical protein BXZ70DRAFT_268063 [Cristinia sonorae]|uniref:Transmembrane protein n=1 Tax=Cristinia sonorae TaxID=1940300 RepID=A0A8K0UYK4_9AGAR|nr:hypothetical protein BXZ70DRAFT_268063 [Cristinia sonorae]